MFSVIIPLYNKEHSIAGAIKSVLNQTLQDFEIIVVNDGSTDNSSAIVDQIIDPRIRLIHQQNQGVSAARNTGIIEAQREWITFLDGDDEWDKDFLQSFKCAIIRNSGIKFFSIGYEIIEPDGLNRKIKFSSKNEFISIHIKDYLRLSLKKPLATSNTVVIHSSVINKIEGFKIGLKRGEDRDYWLRVLLFTKEFIFINKIAAYYHRESTDRVCNKWLIRPEEDMIFQLSDYKMRFEINKHETKLLQKYLSFFALKRAIEYYRARRFEDMNTLAKSVCFSFTYFVKFAFVKLVCLSYRISRKITFVL